MHTSVFKSLSGYVFVLFCIYQYFKFCKRIMLYFENLLNRIVGTGDVEMLA